MNQGRFRLVYSQCLDMFVPVSETTKAQGRKSKGNRERSQYAIAAAMFSISYSYNAVADPLPAIALPTNHVITSGAGSINSIVNAATNATPATAVMTVNQTTKNMIINWDSFNIGSAASVNFIQPGSTSAVLNRVGAGGGLSQIYGNLSANGQVYLINPNGILFGSGAKVNVNSLTASSLNIADDLFNNGILSSTDLAFPATFSGTTGYIQVDAGATLTSASGGRIMMLAPKIDNKGVINTPDGQTLLAAGQKVYLTASGDPNLRGLLVEIDNGGTVNNTYNGDVDGDGKKLNLGQIIAERGNVTLAGIAVNQNGRVKATTSTTANGSIKLQASDTTTVFNNQKRVGTVGGTVTLGENSTTEVLPDATDKATVLDTIKVNKSKVDIDAAKIHLKKGATIVTPSGDVSLVAGLNPFSPTILNSSSSAIANESRIYFDSGSSIDVSGVGSGSQLSGRVGETAAKVAVGSNVVEAELRSPQLADSPLQRTGILRSAKVFVDSRATGVDGNVGTSVADVSGFTSQIKQGISERLATGGNVKLQSEGDIVFNPTASIDVSGGRVDYTSGTVNKTRLQATNGQIFDIANAPKDLNYREIINVSVQEQGYTSGKDAGSVSFSAPAMVLEGKLKGDTIAGARQRTDATRPKGATLQIGQNKAKPTDSALLKDTYVLHSDLMLDVSHSAGAMPAFEDNLSPEQQQTLLLGANFTAPTGFSNLKYYADGQITVKKGTNLIVLPEGNISLNGAGVEVQSNLTAQGGTIELTAKNRNGYIGKQPKFTNNATGNVVVDGSSNLNVSGKWTNDRLNLGATDAVAVDGGEIKITASGKELGGGDVILKEGSSLNASGGAWLSSTSKLTKGKGGDIKLLASEGTNSAEALQHTGKLILDGNLRADSLDVGGSLSLSSGSVSIGKTALVTTGETLIDPTLFQQGGFATYNIDGIDGLTVSENTKISPMAETRVLNSGFNAQQSGTDITNFSRLEMLPARNTILTRKATNINLTASNQFTGKLNVGLGSIISADPGASVSLLGKRQLTMLGSIMAPAGNISLATGLQSGEASGTFYINNQTIWLGANSLLDVSGTTNINTNATGNNIGSVKDAGNIKLNATRGEIVAETGATVKLDGTRAVLDVKNFNTFTTKEVASKGGNLNISAREGILWDATMSAKGGSESVAAGNLSVTLPLLDLDAVNQTNFGISDPKEQFPTGAREIVLKQTGKSVKSGFRPEDEIDASEVGKATMFADKLQNAGFDNIQLSKSNNIRVSESVNLTTRGSITLDTPNVIVNDGANATLNSSYVSIGNSQSQYQDVASVTTPVAGTGTFAVNANYIDLYGNQSLSGTSVANFNSKGDIQLRGVLIGTDNRNTDLVGGLNTSGNMMLSATRVYPSTLANYTLSSTGTDAAIAFKSSGKDSGVPFSVLGKLNVKAANIMQDGVLRAPFGVINLEATNQLSLGSASLTSISAEGKTLPFGTTINGKTWNFDAGEERIAIINTLPEKNINLDAKSVNIASGSKIDLSGGGDLSAYEFTVGTGGSEDVLAADGVFAILPELKAGYMPGNSESNVNTTLKAGDSIYLSGGNGLAAGNYVLLPAHYALLPGGYSVKAVAGNQDFTAQQNVLNRDGSMLLSGYLTQHGGLSADSRSSSFLVASGNIARTQSEFTNTSADKFFNKTDSGGKVSNVRLPADAGRVAISAATNLVLDGDLITKHAISARGAAVDISSDKIAISGDGTQETGYLTISSTKLNSFGAESLTIGGKRKAVAEGTELSVTSSNLKLIGGASLSGQEIMLAATDTISMNIGTSINAVGPATKNSEDLIIGNADTAGSGDGALLRVSTGPQPDLVRKNVSQTTGTLDIQVGAKVSGTSVIADATKSNTVGGDIALNNDGAIRIGAPKISFGTSSVTVTGLQLDNAKLAALGNPSNVQLKSYSTIDFYGATSVGNANLKTLTLESSGLAGYNNAGNTVTLTADTVKFSNPDSATFAPAGTLGAGTLEVNAGKAIGLGNGTFSTNGFSKVNLKADQVIGEAKGTLDVKNGDLTIDSGLITAAGLSDTTIQASGKLETKQHTVTGLAKAPLGGKLTLAADTITHGGIIDLPSGTATLKASGKAGVDSILLLAGSQINAKGSAQMLGTVAGLADGGKVNLQTTNGNVRMENGAVVDVSATGGAGAGTLAVNSAGTATLAGTLNGGATAGNGVTAPRQGSFELSASELVNFSTLNTELERGKFNESRNVRVAKGDLNIAATDTVKAHNFTLTTDNGNLNVAGKIDATGSKGGIVKLNAGQLADSRKGNITLASTSLIDASATTAATEVAGSKGDGGKVLLNTTTDSDTTPSFGSRILATLGSVINVSGKGLGSDGKVTLRAPRTGDTGNGIAIDEFKSTVIGANASIVAEGVKVYKPTNGEINDAFVETMKADNASYQSNANTIASNLGLAADKRLVIAAGNEVRSIGNITVAGDINLQAGGPGALTLRAKGDVNVNANISAGFTTADKNGELTGGGAWTYRIAAGADTNSADFLATNNAGTGNFILADGKLIRTGTGDIEIATGGDFTLATADSAIYTAGEVDTKDYSTLGNFTEPTIVTAKYSVNGGDVTLSSKGNIIGADSTQIPANWLFRQGRVDATTGQYSKNTSWWTFFRDFKQNVGALGGGDVTINAAGEVNDLSAVTATNGRVFGTGPADGKLVQNGGGDLSVQAGGNILGGLYMVDKGSATIRAGGGLLADSGGTNTAFALGDGVIDVATLGQLDMSRVFNPTLTGMSDVNLPRNQINSNSSVFSTYGSESAIKLTSIASGVGITNQSLSTNNLVASNDGKPLQLFPSRLNAVALGGDYTAGEGIGFTLISSPQGDLQLAASGNVNFNSSINMSDREPTLLPSILSPLSTQLFGSQLDEALTTTPVNPERFHAAIPVHQNNPKPVLVYAGKDIIGTGGFSLFLPKKAEVFAGNDINNFSIFGQNLNSSDVTTISAGRDFNVGISGVAWGGPGYLDITAGRDINLGRSEGIITKGNLNNPFLSEAGANLRILVGAAGSDDQAFIAKYLNPAVNTTYQRRMVSFVNSVNGLDDTEILKLEAIINDPEATPLAKSEAGKAIKLILANAWEQFQTKDTKVQRQFVQTAFFEELKQAGEENNAGKGGYKRGFDAIAILFPKDNYDGRLDMAFSQVKTERGGNLTVLAPGGSVLIGLPKTPPEVIFAKGGTSNFDEALAASAAKLGMFTVKGGDINVFADGNIDVAQSRQFTVGGGDIVDWSSSGDIDAGRGSKTATSAPPPLIRTGTDGVTVVDLSGVVSGSGIGTLQTLPTAPIGNVYLIAPTGTVNAGDAGIRSSGNLVVAAQRVLGADNISVGGTSSGVPAVSSSNISFNAPASADANNTNKQDDQLGATDKLGQNSKLAGMPSVISVEVLSLGDEADSNVKKETDNKKCKDDKNKKDCTP
jgi:filamentous hemagglutinin